MTLIFRFDRWHQADMTSSESLRLNEFSSRAETEVSSRNWYDVVGNDVRTGSYEEMDFKINFIYNCKMVYNRVLLSPRLNKETSGSKRWSVTTLLGLLKKIWEEKRFFDKFLRILEKKKRYKICHYFSNYAWWIAINETISPLNI